MKRLKYFINFYVVSCILFFILEIVIYAIDKWADEYSLGAEMVLGLFIPAMLFIFFCIAISSVIVGYYCSIKIPEISEWKAYIPFFIVVSTILIYVILPKTEFNIWYRVLKFYFL